MLNRDQLIIIFISSILAWNVILTSFVGITYHKINSNISNEQNNDNSTTYGCPQNNNQTVNFTDFTNQNQSFQSQITSLQDSLKNISTTENQNNSINQQQFKEINNNFTLIDQTNKQNLDSINTLIKQLTQTNNVTLLNQTNQIFVQNDITTVNNNISSLNQTIQLNSQNINIDEQHINSLSQNISSLNNQIQQLNLIYTNLYNQFQTNQQTIQQLSNSNSNIAAMIQINQQNVNAITNSLTSMSQNVQQNLSNITNYLSYLSNNVTYLFNQPQLVLPKTNFYGSFLIDSGTWTWYSYPGIQKEIIIFPNSTKITITKKSVITFIGVGHAYLYDGQGTMSFFKDGQPILPVNAQQYMIYGAQLLYGNKIWSPLHVIQENVFEIGTYEFGLGFMFQSNTQSFPICGVSFTIKVQELVS